MMRKAITPVTRRSERGVALITALLVVALAAVIATSLMTRQTYDLRRAENLLHRDQALSYALGGEDWAKSVLGQDNREVDGFMDIWATPLPPIPVDGGRVASRIVDLQGRFNLNALVNKEGKPDEVQKARFERLLKRLELDTAIATAVIDWIDPDINPEMGGAEDGEYLGRQPPYRTANRPMQSVTELRLVAGVDSEGYARLAPLVSALPGNAPINLNTAPLEVLLSLADGLDATRLEEVLEARREKQFSSVADFLAQDAFGGQTVEAAGLGVNSNNFLAVTEATIGKARVIVYSVLSRSDKGRTRVLLRSLEPCLPAASCV
ncbi:MAG: type II secretion system minor pseudopilin GspK [Halothiobacillaceae bacterium]|jgi:general secretion pathway protein K|nr:type II secretion system minor pseudopilin GspK [Halothiobacillaceae bacterium]MDY0049253.1 type II secretion system minor pseudopilin GspK [Halothiobacillaceae bacterium]